MKKRSLRYLACVHGLLALAAPSPALDIPMATERNPGPGRQNPSPLQGPFPNLSLPGHVTAPGGSLTLFADHGNPDEEGVPLYLVNRTLKQVLIPASFSEPGVLLEHYDESSRSWRRAQSGPTGMATCVDPPAFPVLPPGQYFRLGGYRPIHGTTEGQVRFRLDSCEVISNGGTGLWREADVANARLDPATMDRQPFAAEYGWWVASSPTEDPDVAQRMIVKLGMMKLWADGPVFRGFARALLAELEKARAAGNPAGTEALPLVEALLAETSPPGVRPEAMFQHSLETLRQP